MVDGLSWELVAIDVFLLWAGSSESGYGSGCLSLGSGAE
jgi:hypothetical protein